jgi:hypothetical protein
MRSMLRRKARLQSVALERPVRMERPARAPNKPDRSMIQPCSWQEAPQLYADEAGQQEQQPQRIDQDQGAGTGLAQENDAGRKVQHAQERLPVVLELQVEPPVSLTAGQHGRAGMGDLIGTIYRPCVLTSGRFGTGQRVTSSKCNEGPLTTSRADQCGSSEMCHDVWSGRASQDDVGGLTNVRAASMYSASRWSLSSGPSWESARIQG